MPEVARSTARRTFAPVVLLGLAGAGLAAVAGQKSWAASADSQASAIVAAGGGADPGSSPAAGAFALVALACWGVVLVTRGRVRRGVAVLAALAAVAVLVTVVAGWSSVPDAVRDAAVTAGAQDPGVQRTGWYWAAAVGGLLTLAASLLAVRWAPGWPEMGSRYDAPTGERAAAPPGSPAGPPPADPAERSSLELWKDMDEGRDPTA